MPTGMWGRGGVGVEMERGGGITCMSGCTLVCGEA